VVGVTLAQTSGSRLDSDEITGDTRPTTLGLLNDARQLFADPEQWDTAIELYDDVLELSPSNEEALTYRAWLDYRQGATVDEAMASWDEVVRIDAGYPDVRVFRAIALTNDEEFEAARDELEVFDSLDPPQQLSDLVNSEGLRGTVYGEVLQSELGGAGGVTLGELGISSLNALAAGDYLLTTETEVGPVGALKLYDAVLADDPDNPVALVRTATIYVGVGEIDRATAALDRLDALPDDQVPDAIGQQAADVRAAIDG
jgi:hypothetical protein